MTETIFPEKNTEPLLIDETLVKSFGAVPLDFDRQEETVDYLRDMVIKRGII